MRALVKVFSTTQTAPLARQVEAELRRTMGANGRRFASHAYSAETVTRQLVQAYNGLLN